MYTNSIILDSNGILEAKNEQINMNLAKEIGNFVRSKYFKAIIS